jgi:hypothetical protein
MSVTPAPLLSTRHALGLPAGSVRALHTLLIVGLITALLLMSHGDQVLPIPAYLQYLLFLAIANFYAAHGHSIARGGEPRPSPLHLPAGFVRLLIFLVLVGVVVFKVITDQAGLQAQLNASMAELPKYPWMPLIILAGFFLGVVFRWITGGERAFWAQDLQAWFTLVSALLLGGAVLIHLVINPSLETPLQLPGWESFLAAVVAFYFGERS